MCLVLPRWRLNFGHGWLVKAPRSLVAVGSDAQQRVPTALEPGRDDLLVVRVFPEGFMSQPCNFGHGAFFHFLIMEPCSILKDMAGGEVAEWPNAAVC